MPAIRVENLSRTYRYYHKTPGFAGSISSLFHRKMLETRAVDNVSFAIERGERVGFLGPNGAGKTTLVKILSGLLHPTSGRATVLDHTPSRRENAYLSRISLVMGQKNMLWWDIPAMETLLLHKEMYDLPAEAFESNLHELSEMLNIAHLLRVQVRKLSLGERMKMELLVALIHQPEVLFLDEPTIGLDVISQQMVRAFFRRLNREQGTTILLTSHYMGDIQELCPRVIVLDKGRLRYDGALDALVHQTAPHKRVSVVFVEPPPEAALAELVDGLVVQQRKDAFRIEIAVPRERVSEVAGRLLALGAVADIGIQDVPVEEIVRGIFAEGVTP